MISLPRAVLAVAAPVLAPPAVVVLARAGRWPGVLALSLLLAVYVVVEVGLWLLRERQRRTAVRAYLRGRGRVLAGVTESREGWL